MSFTIAPSSWMPSTARAIAAAARSMWACTSAGACDEIAPPFDWIAARGYNDASSAFPPLYPATLWAFGHVLGGHYVLAGIAVSLAAAFGSFLLLHRLAEERIGADGARRAVLYIAVFPMSLFLQAVYSESLYLLLTLAAFALAERRRFLAAGGVTGLAVLTRPTGLVLLPALSLLSWPERYRLLAVGSLAVDLVLCAAYS